MSNVRKALTDKILVGKTGKTQTVQGSVSTTTSVNPIKVRPPKTTGNTGKNTK